MMKPEPEKQQFDPWTAMPVEFEDLEYDPLVVAPAVPKKTGMFDWGSLFWRYLASGSADTPPQVLAVLATDERVQIRRRCAENPSTNGDTLAMLADDKSDAVRTAVARNVHTPIYILRKLSQDPSVDVRFAIASNPEMPDAILLSLFLDPDPFVAERASQTLAA
jgi:hypothetical protein